MIYLFTLYNFYININKVIYVSGILDSLNKYFTQRNNYTINFFFHSYNYNNLYFNFILKNNNKKLIKFIT